MLVSKDNTVSLFYGEATVEAPYLDWLRKDVTERALGGTSTKDSFLVVLLVLSGSQDGPASSSFPAFAEYGFWVF